MTKSQAAMATATSEHKELYDYINNLPLNDIIELLNIVFYQGDINMPGKLKDSVKLRKNIKEDFNKFISALAFLMIERLREN